MSALQTDGTCPKCSAEVDTQDLAIKPTTKAPWHFWLMVIALVIYLGWRLVQAVIWIFQSM